MSSTPVQPENAALAAPVRPSGPAKSPSEASALAAPLPPHTATSSSPRAPPAYVHGSPVHEQESASHSPTLTQDSASHSSNASQNKWSRGPVPQPRSTGPSLLTQALATGRATPHGQAELLSESRPTTPYRSHADSASPDAAHNNHDASAYQSDGDTVTPRGSPRAAQRYTTSSNDSPSDSTPRQHPSQEGNQTPTPKMLDTREASSILRAHGEILGRSMGMGNSMERMESLLGEKEPSMRSQSFGVTSEERASGNRPHLGEDPAITQRAHPSNTGDPRDSTAQFRPRKLEHRVTMGPEKAWSIGTGESRDGRDGQVEKSIREVLAGEKPNASSRKASHSLGFFKEGLPEDKTRRKETRAGTHQRETIGDKRSVSGDEPRDLHATDGQASPLPREDGRGSRVSTRPRTPTVQSPAVPSVSESPEDYFVLRTDSSARHAAQPELPFRVRPSGQEPRDSQVPEPAPSQDRFEDYDADARRKSRDSTEAGDGAEDAEDSSEEKISSAVFVPHQGLDEPSEVASQDTRAPPRLAPGSRSLSRSDDFHPWLVKADEPEEEPEIDEQVVQNQEEDDLVPSSQESALPAQPAKAPARILDAHAAVGEPEVAKHALQSSRTFLQYSDEHVHDHQITPKQPLDAIELIPYKHQVGGHTTLWRFSKRAVCKQLNNRENEFYERIERYHRDLLPFLPR